jgi:aspartyl-tRNA(Asn)/glutamyl-tRNA(Gln) amidotransferase subunit A
MMFDVLAGPDSRDPFGQVARAPVERDAGKPVRVGLLLKCGNILDPEVEAATVAAMRKAEALGMQVQPIELDFVSMEEPFLVVLRSLLWARVGKAMEKTPEKLDPTLIETIRAGMKYTAADLCEAQFARTACFAKVQEVLVRCDLIASPTLSAPALPVGLDPLGRVEIAGQDAGTIRGAWYPYTFPFNLTGHPALSIPCGISSAGLPIGLQLVGRWHEDRFLLDCAAKLEEAIGFSSAHPLPR